MKFTDSHEWIELEDAHIAVVGVSNYAQRELGDIVYVELPIEGRRVSVGQEVAVLESTKAAADVYSPASGIIVAVNGLLTTTPELINQSAEKDGWIYKIQLSAPAEIDVLMDRSAYVAMLNGD